MQIFIDSAVIDEIKRWMSYGIADGVTTNPSILRKEGVHDIRAQACAVAACIAPRPLSVEVTTDDPVEMVRQGKEYASWAPNIIIKIPVINSQGVPCLDAVKQLRDAGIGVNVTAILSFTQLVLAVKAGAVFASIFAGRVSDEGGDAAETIRLSKQWITAHGYDAKVLVGSIRTVADIRTAIIAGADIITVPPALLTKMCDHRYGRATVKQFLDDAKA